MKVLSVRQPWAWLIVNGHKDVENRTWSTTFRGEVLIHAAKTMSRNYYEDVFAQCFTRGIELPPYEALERGGIVGIAEIVGCVTNSESPWFFGPCGFVIRNARPLPFEPLRGSLGFFNAPSGYKVLP